MFFLLRTVNRQHKIQSEETPKEKTVEVEELYPLGTDVNITE